MSSATKDALRVLFVVAGVILVSATIAQQRGLPAPLAPSTTTGSPEDPQPDVDLTGTLVVTGGVSGAWRPSRVFYHYTWNFWRPLGAGIKRPDRF